MVRAFAHGVTGRWIDPSWGGGGGVDPFSYFSFQPVFHDWCNITAQGYKTKSNILHIDWNENKTAVGVITPNQIPLTTIVTYLQKRYRSRISNHWATYTCMQCGTSNLQTIQEIILSHIFLATYRKFTVATVRFTQNISCNIYIHPIYQQVIIHQTTKATEYIG